jgi:EAL domain-containing protein (putative c-di-GMP-specific phosphodiesterase class I)
VANSEKAPETRLREVLSQYRREASSRVYVIDFEILKQRLGDKWARLADKVQSIARQSIDRHLSPVDMAALYGECAFLVVFSRLGQREAELKCLLIASEVGRRLVGNDEAGALVKVRGATVSADGDVTFVDADLDASARALRHEVGAAAIHSLRALPRLMTVGLPHWEQIQFIYRPLLSLRGMVVSTFICVPIRPLENHGFASGYRVLADPNDEYQIADLDTVVLAKVIGDLVDSAKNDVRALLCLPVHFQTLAAPRFREVYVELCRRYLTTLGQRVIFELVEMPEGIVQSRLHDLVTTLRPYSRAVIARLPLGQKSFGSFHLAGLHAVGADIYYSHDDETSVMHQMDQFVDKANKEGLKTYIHGLRSVSLTTAAISGGFDYIDGYSLSSIVDIPKRPLRYELQQLYGAGAGPKHQ